jgi:hypothetical protein
LACKSESYEYLSKGREINELLRKHEELSELLTKGMTPAEKVQFELASVEQWVNSEDFQKLMQDCRNKNQLKQEGDSFY